MMKIKERGFTLIELLVVIAIIGILASVVLAALNTARDKGTDAAYKSSLNNMRAQAELFYDDAPRSYAGLCADPNVAEVLTDTGAVCLAAASSYVIAVDLVSTAGDVYCVDYTGTSLQGAVAGGSTDAAQEILDNICDGS